MIFAGYFFDELFHPTGSSRALGSNQIFLSEVYLDMRNLGFLPREVNHYECIDTMAAIPGTHFFARADESTI
jgi:hypothetical protein